MIIVIVLLALPIGYFCRDRTVGFLCYGLAFAHVYSFQTALLVMEWVNGADAAFPQDDSTQLLGGTLGYFTFTTMILAIGLALVVGGQRLRTRRDRRRTTADLSVSA